MSDPKSANDPSMDDILASIRKIISDDEARAQVNSQQAAAQSGGRPAVTPPRSRGSPSCTPPAATTCCCSPTSSKSPGRTPCRRRSRCRASIRCAPPRCRSPRSSRPGPPIPRWSAAGLPAARASAFARLNRAVQDSVPPPAAADPGPVVGTSGKTVEELVKETLRPMLKEWLDQNLPQVVERYVEREIVRLTRR